MTSFSIKSAAAAICVIGAGLATGADKFNPTEDALNFITKMKVSKYDWPQWGGSPHRNNTPEGEDIPSEWNLETGENVLWAAPLGSQTYGNPVVANGKVFVGTNNTHGYLKRYPSKIDLGALVVRRGFQGLRRGHWLGACRSGNAGGADRSDLHDLSSKFDQSGNKLPLKACLSNV